MVDNELLERFLDERNRNSCLDFHIPGNAKFFIQLLFEKDPPVDFYCPKCKTRQYTDEIFCHVCGSNLNRKQELPEAKELIINFHYPFLDPPVKVLQMLGVSFPPGSEVVAWEKNISATISFPIINKKELSKLIDLVFLKVQGVEDIHYIEATIDYGF